MSPRYFVLCGRQAMRTTDHRAWSRWFEMTNMRDRLVAITDVGPIHVSTAFIGLDECIFQTMVFGGRLDGEVQRYRTYEEAEAGHWRVVERVRLSEKD